jgi:hypothetical protein
MNDGSLISSQSWSRDVYLMHHYSRYTSVSFAMQDPDMEKLWRDEIPELGIDHPHLMHGLIALAALHLIAMRPERRSGLAMCSLQHQKKALGFCKSSLINLNESNFHPTCALSMVLCTLSTVYSEHVALLHPTGVAQIGDILEPVIHVRGLHNMLRLGQNWLVCGPLARFTGNIDVRTGGNLPITVREQFRCLNSMIRENSSPGPVRVSLSEALEMLRDIYCEVIQAARNGHVHPRIPWQWPAMVNQEFISLLQGSHAPSLVIFVHFSMLIHLFNREWHFAGYADRALNAVSKALPEVWQNFLEWPREQLGSELRGLFNHGAENLKLAEIGTD